MTERRALLYTYIRTYLIDSKLAYLATVIIQTNVGNSKCRSEVFNIFKLIFLLEIITWKVKLIVKY
jgi:hypothetical protein